MQRQKQAERQTDRQRRKNQQHRQTRIETERETNTDGLIQTETGTERDRQTVRHRKQKPDAGTKQAQGCMLQNSDIQNFEMRR